MSAPNRERDTLYLRSSYEQGHRWRNDEIQSVQGDHVGVARDFGLAAGGEVAQGEVDVFSDTSESGNRLDIYIRVASEYMSVSQLEALETQIDIAVDDTGRYYLGLEVVSPQEVRNEVGPEAL